MKSISLGRTFNMGNFESLRIDITVDKNSQESIASFIERAINDLNVVIHKIKNDIHIKSLDSVPEGL